MSLAFEASRAAIRIYVIRWSWGVIGGDGELDSRAVSRCAEAGCATIGGRARGAGRWNFGGRLW